MRQGSPVGIVLGVPTAGIYCRISDDRDGSGAGVARQQADCRALAERKGWTVGDVFIDNSVSAWGDRRRPEYRRMLAAIKAGEIDAVVVWHLDRLHRRPVELEEFFEVCDGAQVRHLASVTGDVDLATDDGRFMARILGAVARKESDDKSRRVRRKHLELAEQGKPVGSGRPFGYLPDRVTVDQAEADLIREAARRVVDGDTVRSIVADWNRRAIPAAKGGRWTQTSLRRVLTAPRVAGMRGLGRDTIVAKAVWEPILDEMTWRRVRLIVLDPDRRVNGGFGTRYLLTGLAVCGLCGHRLIARPHSQRKPCYCCTSDPGRGGCGRIRVSSLHLDDEVAARVVAAYNDNVLLETIRGQSVPGNDEELLARVADDEATLDQLARDLANKLLTRSEWLAARQVIERRIGSVRRLLVRRSADTVADRWAGHGVDLAAAWGTLNVEQRRAAIAAIVEEIRVNPATPGRGRFEPSRVRILWKTATSTTGHQV